MPKITDPTNTEVTDYQDTDLVPIGRQGSTTRNVIRFSTIRKAIAPIATAIAAGIMKLGAPGGAATYEAAESAQTTANNATPKPSFTYVPSTSNGDIFNIGQGRATYLLDGSGDTTFNFSAIPSGPVAGDARIIIYGSAKSQIYFNFANSCTGLVTTQKGIASVDGDSTFVLASQNAFFLIFTPGYSSNENSGWFVTGYADIIVNPFIVAGQPSIDAPDLATALALSQPGDGTTYFVPENA